ncbi:GntR family transcriptional regulator [Sphingomonas sp. CJ99]
MNGGPTAERVLDGLRRMILERDLRPGMRLDPAALSERLLSSATPVREALCVLLGERLVEVRPGGGFHVPIPDAPGIADLYGWCGEVAAMALRAAVPLRPLAQPDPVLSHADRMARILGALADASPNAEHGLAMRGIIARLHAARLVEPICIPDMDGEQHALEAALERGDAASLRAGLARYHRRRQRAAPAIARALLRE